MDGRTESVISCVKVDESEFNVTVCSWVGVGEPERDIVLLCWSVRLLVALGLEDCESVMVSRCDIERVRLRDRDAVTSCVCDFDHVCVTSRLSLPECVFEKEMEKLPVFVLLVGVVAKVRVKDSVRNGVRLLLRLSVPLRDIVEVRLSEVVFVSDSERVYVTKVVALEDGVIKFVALDDSESVRIVVPEGDEVLLSDSPVRVLSKETVRENEPVRVVEGGSTVRERVIVRDSVFVTSEDPESVGVNDGVSDLLFVVSCVAVALGVIWTVGVPSESETVCVRVGVSVICSVMESDNVLLEDSEIV